MSTTRGLWLATLAYLTVLHMALFAYARQEKAGASAPIVEAPPWASSKQAADDDPEERVRFIKSLFVPNGADVQKNVADDAALSLLVAFIENETIETIGDRRYTLQSAADLKSLIDAASPSDAEDLRRALRKYVITFKAWHHQMGEDGADEDSLEKDGDIIDYLDRLSGNEL